jgi:hypothetical protein
MDKQVLRIDMKKLPMIVELVIENIKKEYVIKPNKEKTGIFLNKLEQY